MHIVYKSEPERGLLWQAWLAQHAPDIQLHLWPDIGEADQVEILVAWQPPANILATFPNLKVLFSVGAGADQFDLSALPPDLPVVRMIEPGLTQGMVEYITFSVIGLHRDMPRYFQQQRNQQWLAHNAIPASQRRVGIMGLGELGQAALKQLVPAGAAQHAKLRGALLAWRRSASGFPCPQRHPGLPVAADLHHPRLAQC